MTGNIGFEDVKSLGISLLYSNDKEKTIKNFMLQKTLGSKYTKLKQTQKMINRLNSIWGNKRQISVI